MRQSARPRIRIRPPKKAASADVVKDWSELLAPAIKHILHRDKSSLSFETLYNTCYRLVVQHHGKALYKRFHEELKTYLADDILTKLCSSSREDLIATTGDQWDQYTMALTLISDIFMYLNRAYCDEVNTPRVEIVGQLLFRDEVLRGGSGPFVARLYREVLDELDRVRSDEVLDRMKLKKVIDMLRTLPADQTGVSDSMYAEELEQPLVESASAYYLKRLNEICALGASAIETLQTVEKWVIDESNYSAVYLPPTTRDQITQVLESGLVAEALQRALNSDTGASTWLESDDLSALIVAARLEARTSESGSHLVKHVSDDVRSRQLAINQAALAGQSQNLKPVEVASQWVRDTVKLETKFQNISKAVSELFENTRSVVNTLQAVWVDAMNKSPKVCEYLTLDLDELLKKSPANTRSEAEIEKALDDSLVVFEAIPEKDRFATSYSLHLARRLLNNRSYSEDLERSFIAKLTKAAGSSTTFHFEGMFKDYRMSRELSASFRHSHPEAVSTKVNVLTLTMWPTFCTTEHDVVLPERLAAARHEFQEFYTSKYSSRKLRWNLGIGSADIDLTVHSGTYTVTLTLYALSILNLFHGNEQLTIQQVVDASKVPLGDVHKQLHALTMNPRTQLLRKTQPGPISDDDVFSFNESFQSPKKHVKVLALAATARSETAKRETESLDDLKKTRAFKVDAAIVRIMKARMRYTHSQLVQEVTAQLAGQFKPTPAAIKQGIGALIETEYIQRLDDDPSTYIYLA